jgi:hypothetical protein
MHRRLNHMYRYKQKNPIEGYLPLGVLVQKKPRVKVNSTRGRELFKGYAAGWMLLKLKKKHPLIKSIRCVV